MFAGNWEFNTELQAVNEIMSAIGEAPVQTLEGDTNVDVVNARRLLHTMNRQIQSRGWSFNIDEDVQVIPDVFSNLITYQPEWLTLYATDGNSYTNRGGYLYNRTLKTDIFASPVTFNMIVLRPFDEMPVAFQTYIVAKAARTFNSRFFGAPELAAELEEAERDAERFAMEYELDHSDVNAYQGDVFISGAVGR